MLFVLGVLMDGDVCPQRGKEIWGGVDRDRILAYSEEKFGYSSVKLSGFTKFRCKPRTTSYAYFAYSRKYAHTLHTLHTKIIRVK